MLPRLLTLAALVLLPLGLSGCVVAPAPGYYRPPPVTAGVYVAPRPYPYAYRPYRYGWGPRPYPYARPYRYWR
jgi:hypothetical protein